MTNPYQSPQPSSGVTSPAAGAPRDKLRAVAKYQRWVIFSLLVNIATNILAMATAQLDPSIGAVVLVLALGAAVFAMVSIFLLTNTLMNTAAAVLCALLMIVPCVSLIVLLIVNQKATGYLQQHGISVGFFGVSPDRI